MSLQDKYRKVLDLGLELNVQDGSVKEEGGKLHVGGTVQTQYEKNTLWDEIKEVGGDSPSDISADFKVAHTEYLHKHIVKKGESLSLIAKHYYKDAGKWKHIHEANEATIPDANLIHVGQEVIIPNP